MILEIYGLPASGKTTMALKLSDKAGYKIIKIRSRAELLYYNFLFFIKHPVKFSALFYYIAVNSGNWRVFYHKLMNCFLHPNGRLEKAKRFQKAIVDQGHFLNIWAVFENKSSEKELKKYLRYAVMPDILIIFAMGKNILEQRSKNRGYFAREEYGQDYLNNWQKAMAENDKILKNIIGSMPVKTKLIRNEADEAGLLESL